MKMKMNIDRIKNAFAKSWKWIILILCVVCFAVLTIAMHNGKIMNTDANGYMLISTYIMSDIITPFIKTVTNTGGALWLIIMSLILFAGIKNRKLGLSIFLNLILSGSINTILKEILQRPRPIGYRIVNEIGYSFPSGHSMVSMAFYGYLIYLVYKKMENVVAKTILIVTLCVLIIAIGISRIYLGVHYTSDVLAGYIGGIAYLIVFISTMNVTLLREKKKLKEDSNNYFKGKEE